MPQTQQVFHSEPLPFPESATLIASKLLLPTMWPRTARPLMYLWSFLPFYLPITSDLPSLCSFLLACLCLLTPACCNRLLSRLPDFRLPYSLVPPSLFCQVYISKMNLIMGTYLFRTLRWWIILSGMNFNSLGNWDPSWCGISPLLWLPLIGYLWFSKHCASACCALLCVCQNPTHLSRPGSMWPL